jgi:hypothetical protein
VLIKVTTDDNESYVEKLAIVLRFTSTSQGGYNIASIHLAGASARLFHHPC